MPSLDLARTAKPTHLFRDLAETLVKGLNGGDKQAFASVSMSLADMKAWNDTASKRCPEQQGQALAAIDSLEAHPQAALDEDMRLKRRRMMDFESCRQRLDFGKAVVKRVLAKGVKENCGLASANDLVIVVDIAGRDAFVIVDNPQGLAGRWRTTQAIVCFHNLPTQP